MYIKITRIVKEVEIQEAFNLKDAQKIIDNLEKVRDKSYKIELWEEGKCLRKTRGKRKQITIAFCIWVMGNLKDSTLEKGDNNVCYRT